jgi:hypothetical protein
MIVREIYESEWIDHLLDDELAGWSYLGAQALYDYYWTIAIKDCKPFILDLDFIRSEWSEYLEEDARNRFGVEHEITEIGLNMHPRVEEVIAFKHTKLNAWRYLIRLKR